MTAWYGIKHSSGELLSFQMAVLVHDNPQEMEWLICPCQPIQLTGTTLREVSERLGRRVMRLRDHPSFASLTWPLNKQDFWQQGK